MPTPYDVVTRWCSRDQRHGVYPDADAFVADILAVCAKHQLTLSHEDRHGSFVIEPYDPVANWAIAKAVWDGGK